MRSVQCPFLSEKKNGVKLLFIGVKNLKINSSLICFDWRENPKNFILIFQKVEIFQIENVA
jgi:hypothetical protein